MRVISDLSLRAFCAEHPEAHDPVWAWRQIILATSFPDFASLKQAFNSVDRVGNYHVFNIGGNKYRLVASIHFNRQMLFVREVLTHKESDKWKP
jgi:mRNA interferase HigB